MFCFFLNKLQGSDLEHVEDGYNYFVKSVDPYDGPTIGPCVCSVKAIPPRQRRGGTAVPPAGTAHWKGQRLGGVFK